MLVALPEETFQEKIAECDVQFKFRASCFQACTDFYFCKAKKKLMSFRHKTFGIILQLLFARNADKPVCKCARTT